MHIVLLAIGIGLVVYLLWLNFGTRRSGVGTNDELFSLKEWNELTRLLESNSPFPSDERKAITDALKAKGKLPWIMRDKGLGVLELKDGRVLPECFDYLDAYEARTAFDLRDEKPVFTEGYKDQEGKADGFSRALEYHLKDHLPFPFRAIAGRNKVDVVTLADYGNKAYVFVVDKTPGDFMRQTEGAQSFYYDLPTVLLAMESFVKKHPRMEEVIWLEREDSFFMFVIQLKL